MCIKMGNVPEAVKEIGNVPAREAIHQIFLKAIDANMSDYKGKMLVVEAAIQARRDLINGVPEVYVIWEFCRFISQ